MKVAWRLYSAVAPAILGVLLVAGLSYYGRYARTAPELLVALAAIAAVASLIVAWTNTRHVATRVEKLAELTDRLQGLSDVQLSGKATDVARTRHGDDGKDEIEAIAKALDMMSQGVIRARTEASLSAEEASRRTREYATLLSETTTALSQRIEEVRMPLHILLENRFGELNDNQEEMIGAARVAAEEAESDLRRLRDIADVDRGALTPRFESIRPTELVESILPQLRAQATKASVRLEVDLDPTTPRIMADRARMRDAIQLAMSEAVRWALPGSLVRVTMASTSSDVELRAEHGSYHERTGNLMLAERLVAAQGGSISEVEGTTVVRMRR